jgi:acyl-CoA oxidase
MGAHDTVFAAAVRTQASAEQQAQWMPLIKHRGILGCYAQTELAHVRTPLCILCAQAPDCLCGPQGSNVQALLTTATYLPDADAFELHTPCLEATKWWIGDLVRRAARTNMHTQTDGHQHAYRQTG